jgi:hypothetical protein
VARLALHPGDRQARDILYGFVVLLHKRRQVFHFNDLLCGPLGSRVCRHIEMDHLPPIVQQYDEAVQDVSGLTLTSMERQSRHSFERAIQNKRSR